MRPGLSYSAPAKRKLEAHKKAAENRRLQKGREEEVRIEGLTKSLDDTNKGFQLLRKTENKKNSFPFNQPSTSRTSTQSEPVPIVIKTSRSGLGQEKYVKKMRQAAESSTRQQFVDQVKQRADVRLLLYDIRASQKACYNLDSESGITQPECDLFWPSTAIQLLKSSEESEANVAVKLLEDLTEDELLNLLNRLTERLRQVYHFCVWCGIRFESESDMGTNCPGDNRLLHSE